MQARILVVEDDPASLELMSYLLRAHGFVTLTVGCGLDAINAARAEPVDLIVCDIHLPDMDGYEIARLIKADPQLRLVPLVAVTALAMVGDREKVLAAGFDAYVSKPIDPETFVTQLRPLLGARMNQKSERNYAHWSATDDFVPGDFKSNIKTGPA